MNVKIAQELAVRPQQVEAAIKLLDEGSTVPFIARYRKEATGGLDDTQLRTLAERLIYLRELEERRGVILESIRSQDKLTPVLETEIQAAETKTRLEDLYLPYRPKRRTKAQIAREAGLEPLADRLFADPSLDPVTEAAAYIDAEKAVADEKAALEGARHIIVERFSEDAGLLQRLRPLVADEGRVVTKEVEEKQTEGAKFRDYFDYSEPLGKVPAHRVLAMLRARNEGVLTIGVEVPSEEGLPHKGERIVAGHFQLEDQGRPADTWLLECARHAWQFRIAPHLETDFLSELRERAEAEAVDLFGRNLRELLLAPPAGQKPVLGLDPGLRTGVKVAVVDATGRLVDTTTVYPHPPKNDKDGAITALVDLIKKHEVALVAIGNGTGSRETDRLVGDLIARHPEVKVIKAMVSEAGASVYSASESAAKEFPNLDVSLRGAVSIARRLQDPLAELVKIDPKSIGVGQYQHDVKSGRLARALDGVVEDCVNAVGVDLNTASIPLLSRVAGLSEGLARSIVAKRDADGAFRSRQELLKVPRLGPKTFEQAAGFLRIRDGENPLDASAVHPEAYPLVERILAKLGTDLTGLIGNTAKLRALEPDELADDTFGVPTVTDVLKELEKPGRDPRPEFKTAAFRDDITELSQLEAGMMLEGVVTNVTAFGAFVDVGVHQDGLVHISQLADRFVQDPLTVVKPGDIVKVRVLEVDVKRKRIGLSMRSEGGRSEGGRSEGGRSESGRPEGGRQDSGRAETGRGRRGDMAGGEAPRAQAKAHSKRQPKPAVTVPDQPPPPNAAARRARGVAVPNAKSAGSGASKAGNKSSSSRSDGSKSGGRPPVPPTSSGPESNGDTAMADAFRRALSKR